MYLLTPNMVPITNGDVSKHFMNVVRTIANSTTYYRKPGDCNGTIIFEIDIMEKLIPTQFKIHNFCHVKTKITLLF